MVALDSAADAPETPAVPLPELVEGGGGILAIDNNQGFLVTLELALTTALPEVPFHSAINGFVAGALIERLRPKVRFPDPTNEAVPNGNGRH